MKDGTPTFSLSSSLSSYLSLSLALQPDNTSRPFQQQSNAIALCQLVWVPWCSPSVTYLFASLLLFDALDSCSGGKLAPLDPTPSVSVQASDKSIRSRARHVQSILAGHHRRQTAQSLWYVCGTVHIHLLCKLHPPGRRPSAVNVTVFIRLSTPCSPQRQPNTLPCVPNVMLPTHKIRAISRCIDKCKPCT